MLRDRFGLAAGLLIGLSAALAPASPISACESLAAAAAAPVRTVPSGSKPAQTEPTGSAGDAYTVWLCPMHRDHQAHDEGRCPLCGMELVRRTLVTRYVCLGIEDGVVEESPGRCPDTGDPLVPATREVVWYCPEASDRFFVEPGVCASGAPRAETTRVSEHGDHNPRHGGILFMAPNGIHHLEGALEDGQFRLYFYDSFTRPLPPAPFEARLVEVDEAGAPIGDPVALAAPSPAPSSDAPLALSAPVTTDPDERTAFTAFVHFPAAGAVRKEDRFDFIFLSEAERAALGGGAAAASAALPELRVPETPRAILEAIRDRDRRVQTLIAAGRWADLFIPALEAKTLALAYGEQVGERRPWVALKQIVRGAWLLDLYGDLGDRTRVAEAYEIFAEGMRALPELAPDGG